MHHDVVAREPLRHDPLDEVTASVEPVTLADGRTCVREQLRAPAPPSSSSASSVQWAASDDSRHWSSRCCEAHVHRDAALRPDLPGTGQDPPVCEVEEVDGGAVLWVDDVLGVPGERFELADLDDDAWAQPLVRETWPAGAPAGWQRLVAAREHLLRVEESLPRPRSHLDLGVPPAGGGAALVAAERR